MDLEIEVAAGDTASVILSTSGTYDVEVELQSVTLTGQLTNTEVVEVDFPGPVVIKDSAILPLPVGDPVPPDTAVGTVIVRI